MQTFLELIKQRRFWAGISALLSIVLPAMGVAFDADAGTETGLAIGSAVSILLATVLPWLSLYKPKQK